MATYYSSGYEQAAKNAGYTSKDQVAALQRQLNSAGANLTVDGIWGPQTQAAFQQLSAGGSSAVQSASGYLSQLQQLLSKAQQDTGQNPYAQQLLELITPKDDAAYQAQARATVLPGYQAQVEGVRQSMDASKLAHEQDQAQLELNALASRDRIQADYAQQQSELETDANRRGMGRSSYYLDSKAYLGQQQNQALSQVEQALFSSLKDANDAQSLAQAHYQQTLARLESDLADSLKSYESSLREKDKSNAQSAYQSLMDSYDAYRRYQSQDVSQLLTQLYTITAEKEAQASQSAASTVKASSSSSKAKKKQASGSPSKESSSLSYSAPKKSYYEDFSSNIYINRPGTY